MSWFRKFIRQHLIADDPAPEYSRLDHRDGLRGTAMNAEPSTTRAETRAATIAAIQARITAAEDTAGLVEQPLRDPLYLLGLVREQAATLDAVKSLAGYLETLDEVDKHYAALIRAALTATEGS